MHKNRIIFPLLLSAFVGSICGQDVRQPAVAGQFYPADATRLKSAIQAFLNDACATRVDNPIGIVVPHAGYIFSGQICADAYRQVAGQKTDVVIILGTNHTAPGFTRISVLDHGGYQTPLGLARVDEAAATELLSQDKDCTKEQGPQAKEHSVEVQVPFIQTVFPSARIVPVVLGEPDLAMCTRFGQALAKIVKDRKALIVASSDLSHYPSYSDATYVDRQTLETLVKLDPSGLSTRFHSLMAGRISSLVTCACGEAPILALLTAAKSLGATRGVVVSYANSGDTAVGDESRVVGYGSVVLASGKGESDTKALDRPKAPSFSALQPADKKALLKVARETIQRYLTTDTTPLVRGLSPRLEYPQGVFVTLKKHGDLRGCIGHIPPDAPLGRAVGAMAVQAAFNDPRFKPLETGELALVEIEISALTPTNEVKGPDSIVIGRDGVVIAKNGHSAVFLPQVAVENGWGRDEMLDNLCRKAGLPADGWKSGAKFLVFQADVFDEKHYR
jgi:hypothetical protein